MTAQTGRWERASNLSADSKGSIHDDEQARALGFQGALIGGSVICAFVVRDVVGRFGPSWYERGFLKQTFVNPLYEVDEFAARLADATSSTADEALVDFELVKRDGSLISAGYAGVLRADVGPVAPWQRESEPGAPESAGDPLPEMPVGSAYPPRDVRVEIEESAERRRLSRDENPWYTESSPWGGPIVPGFMHMLLGLGDRPPTSSSTMRAGMNGTFQLLHRGPMFAGEPYRLQATLVEKGVDARTVYRTNEFTVSTADGSPVAVARQKVRWMRE